MDHNPVLLEQLREMLADVSEITLVADMPGPVDIRDNVPVMAVTRKATQEQFTKEAIAHEFATCHKGRKIALYQVYEQQVLKNAVVDPFSDVVKSDDEVERFYVIRFASYQ